MSKSLWSSLGINPKTSFYFSNGTGRDTYIMNDNGGTVKARPVSGFPQPGRFIKTSEGFRSYKPQSDNKVVHYVSDGSGRDNYILINSGGLMNKTYTISQRFQESLREPINSSLFQGDKTKIYNPELNKRQRIQSAKMSRPKRTSIPFNNFVTEAINRRQQTCSSQGQKNIKLEPLEQQQQYQMRQ